MATTTDERVQKAETPTTVVHHGEDTSISGIVDFVKAYAKQETVEPLKGAGQFLAFGVLGALLVGLGGSLVLLGLLRLLQNEFDRRLATGLLSWASYAIVVVIAIVAIALAAMRINKPTLQKGRD